MYTNHNDDMSWIQTISYNNATGRLKKLYDRVKGPDNNVDNVMMIHSLRPHSMIGHMNLYKNVLHNANNTLPKWYLEALGVYVSYLNKCDYCFHHHFAGMARLMDDKDRSDAFRDAVIADDLSTVLDGQFLEGIRYASLLTFDASDITESDIDELRLVGFDDGEILEINQVVSYFNYVNRMVVGLGVNTDGDIIGLSPSNNIDEHDWGHR